MTLNLPLPLAEINRRSPRASATLACHAHDRQNAHASAGHNRRGRLRGRRAVLIAPTQRAEAGWFDLWANVPPRLARFGRPIISEAETFDCND
jgi:hypothetical protein